MARSQGSSTPPFIFSAGCLFILLVTAVQIWRIRGDSAPSRHATQLPIINFEDPAPKYGAEIRAETVFTDAPLLAQALPAPPVATKIQLAVPSLATPSIRLNDPPMQVLETSGIYEKPLVMGDISVEPLFSDTITQALAPPTPTFQDFPVPRPMVLSTPSNLAKSQTIEAAVAPDPPPDPPEEPASRAVPQEQKPAPVIRRLAKRSDSKPEKSAVPSKASTAYSHPDSLLTSVRELRDPRAAIWAQRTEAAVIRLLKSPTLNAIEAVPALTDLRRLQKQAPDIASSIVDRTEQSKVLSTGYALDRRLATYSAIRRAMHPGIQRAIKRIRNEQEWDGVAKAVANIRQALGTDDAAAQWTEFLFLDDLDGLAESSRSEHGTDRLNMATRVLDRIATPNTTVDQRRILETPLIKTLQRELRYWATAPIDYQRLIRDLEDYEANPSVQVGDLLTRKISQLRWSWIPQQNHVGHVLDSHYRNANVRVAMTQEFMNRMLPVIQDVKTPVREVILGARVFGNSATWTKTGVELIPDPTRIHMELLANGFMAAETRSFKGPVVAFNRNRSEFHLRKPILIDADGIHVGQSNAVSKASTNLTGLKSQYDKYPFLGSMVRRIAKQKFIEQRQLTRRIIERRVANKVENQVDRQVTQQLADAQEQLREKILVPMRKMNLNPEPISMKTTSERIVFRGRLSGYHQLAAYTARPRAIVGNLVSFQLHESSANNVIQQLRLDGTQGDLRELLTEMADNMQGVKMEVPDEVPKNVHVQLADHDALRVYFEEGRVRFTLRIAKLSTRRRDWKNFAVSANYTPYPKGFQIELGREGVIELSGRRLNLRDQVALRGIFGKVFSKNRNMNLVQPSIAADERLSDLEFSQVVLRDGWLGVSVDDEPARLARSQAETGHTVR